jgi:hypothetical protein
MTMTSIKRGDIVYVAYQPGDKPNTLRSWPQMTPDDRNVLGSAPEGSAMHIVLSSTVPSRVDGQPVSYPNPFRSPTDNMTWWYVRAFAGSSDAPRGQVIKAWTAQDGRIDGAWKQFLAPLAARSYWCDEPGQSPLKSYLAAGKRAFVATERLVLLRGPGGGYQLIRYLSPGETLTVLGAPHCDSSNRLWWETDRGGGWVCETEPASRGTRLNLVPLTV